MTPASCLLPVRPLLSPRSLTRQRANPEMRGHWRPQEPPGEGWPLWGRGLTPVHHPLMAGLSLPFSSRFS